MCIGHAYVDACEYWPSVLDIYIVKLSCVWAIKSSIALILEVWISHNLFSYVCTHKCKASSYDLRV